MNLRKWLVKKKCNNCKYWDLWTTDAPCVTCNKDGVLTKWEAKEDVIQV